MRELWVGTSQLLQEAVVIVEHLVRELASSVNLLPLQVSLFMWYSISDCTCTLNPFNFDACIRFM